MEGRKVNEDTGLAKNGNLKVVGTGGAAINIKSFRADR